MKIIKAGMYRQSNDAIAYIQFKLIENKYLPTTWILYQRGSFSIIKYASAFVPFIISELENFVSLFNPKLLTALFTWNNFFFYQIN